MVANVGDIYGTLEELAFQLWQPPQPAAVPIYSRMKERRCRAGHSESGTDRPRRQGSTEVGTNSVLHTWHLSGIGNQPTFTSTVT